MMWPWMWGSTGMGWGMWIWFLLFMGCVWFFFMWWPRPYRHRSHRRYREDPLEVAQMRLARGETTQKEYEEIRKTLES